MISDEDKVKKSMRQKAEAEARAQAWAKAEAEARAKLKARAKERVKALRDITLLECFEDAAGYQFVETENALSGRRRWFVKTELVISAVDALAAARAYVGTDGAACPNLLDSFPGASNCVATSFHPQRDSEDPSVFNIDIDYAVRSSGSAENPEAPWEDPPNVSVENQSMEVPFERDLDGKPVLNSAGGKIEATTEIKIKVITITRASLTFSPTVSTDAEGSINPDAISICGYPAQPYCAQLVTWVASPAYTPKGTKYYEQTIVIQVIVGQAGVITPITWRFELMDLGVYYLEDGEQVRFTDGKGNEMVQGQKLDGAGGDGRLGTGVYLSFKRFKEDTSSWPNLPSRL